MDLSFSGAGFMGCYYFGVVNCWNKYIPRDRVRRVAGASAGSLIAAYYLMDLSLSDCLREIIEMTEDVRRRPLGVFDRSNQIVDILPRSLDRMFPDDAHKRVSGRLFVAMTRLKDMKCVIVNEFESKKDLIDALNCSCFIPVWSGNHVSTYKGTKYIDGGFTNNMPVFDEHTIRICCFSGASDIAPHDRAQNDFMSTSVMGMPVNFTWKNMRRAGRALWPPPPNFIIDLLERGFHDTKDFILSNDLIQCNKCFKASGIEMHSIYSKITPTISPAASPSVSRATSFMNLADLQRSSSFRRLNGSDKDNGEQLQASNKDKRRDRSASGCSSTEENPMTAATIKQLKALLNGNQKDVPSVFANKRSKSGKQIKLKSLVRMTSDVQLPKEKKSLTRKLRDKLQRVRLTGVGKAASPTSDKGDSLDEPEFNFKARRSTIAAPTIVVDEVGTVESESDEFESAQEEQQQPVVPVITISEIMRQEKEQDEEQELHQGARGSLSNDSISDDADANSQSNESSDSAVGDLRNHVDRPNAEQMGRRRASQSPAEKFLASRKMSLVASQLDLQRQEQQSSLLPDRFAFAPSLLPSCPPSPNLNRHCSECIRMRQQARMDALDESIMCEAEKYRKLESKDPEKEFNSIRHKLTSWFRQFGQPKYSYDMYESEDELVSETHARAARQHIANSRRRASEIPSYN